MRTRYKVIYADRPGTKARPHSATSKSEACMIAERAVAGRRKPPRVVIKDSRGRKVSCGQIGQLGGTQGRYCLTVQYPGEAAQQWGPFSRKQAEASARRLNADRRGVFIANQLKQINVSGVFRC